MFSFLSASLRAWISFSIATLFLSMLAVLFSIRLLKYLFVASASALFAAIASAFALIASLLAAIAWPFALMEASCALFLLSWASSCSWTFAALLSILVFSFLSAASRSVISWLIASLFALMSSLTIEIWASRSPASFWIAIALSEILFAFVWIFALFCSTSALIFLPSS